MNWKLSIVILLFTSCSTSHHCYKPIRPEAKWSRAQEVETDDYPEKWWDLFKDPTLSSLIENAYENNYSLKSAYEKVIQALYLRKQVCSQYFPQIDGTGNYTKSLSQFAIGSSLFSSGTTTDTGGFNFANGAKQELFIGGVDAIWEIDLFRHTYHEVRAACAMQGSLIESFRGIKVTLAAEIARLYFTIRWQQMNNTLLQEQIENLEQIIVLNESLRKKGIKSDFPTLETIKQIETLRKNLATTQAEKANALYKVLALLGDLPSKTLYSLLESSDYSIEIPEKIAVGIPADVLKRRPDIREAEKNIEQAAAEIDVAIADFFPRLTLTGNAKREKTTFQSLTATGPAWSFGTHLLAPVFQGGRLRAQYLEKKSAWRQNVYNYYETVVNAIAEAESAISFYEQGTARENAAHHAYRAEKSDFFKRTSLRDAGITDDITWIHARNAKITALLEWQHSRYEQILAIISLYKALGGGW